MNLLMNFVKNIKCVHLLYVGGNNRVLLQHTVGKYRFLTLRIFSREDKTKKGNQSTKKQINKQYRICFQVRAAIKIRIEAACFMQDFLYKGW
jgi:hypothetical protein